MTTKIYKTAMGKPVDIGELFLQNETVRAVGNMGVNARGDVIDSGNKVIDRKNRQVQRQYRRTTNVSDTPVGTSNVAVRKAAQDQAQYDDQQDEILDDTETASGTDVQDTAPAGGGLAAAIAKARSVQQTLETPIKTQIKSGSGVKKI